MIAPNSIINGDCLFTYQLVNGIIDIIFIDGIYGYQGDQASLRSRNVELANDCCKIPNKSPPNKKNAFKGRS